MTEKEKEILLKKVIKLIKEEFDCRCAPQDFTEGCIECHAGKAVRFLKKYINLLDFE